LNKNRLQLKQLTYKEGEQKRKIDLGTNRNTNNEEDNPSFYENEEQSSNPSPFDSVFGDWNGNNSAGMFLLGGFF
jgi:hypothetical protein